MHPVKSDRSELEKISVRDNMDLSQARIRALWYAMHVGFDVFKQTHFVTAVSELATNMVNYANGGSVQFDVVTDDQRTGVVATFTDHGPGIPDIEMAMKEGYTTSGGLGMGLPGAKKLVDSLEIQSRPGRTRIQILKWK
jgi:serine/threonine-protein kinase RsbT